MSKRTLDDLVEVMAKLRGNPGCPGTSLKPTKLLNLFLWKSYEVIDAIDRKVKKILLRSL